MKRGAGFETVRVRPWVPALRDAALRHRFGRDDRSGQTAGPGLASRGPGG